LCTKRIGAEPNQPCRRLGGRQARRGGSEVALFTLLRLVFAEKLGSSLW
jgi:hypothetical protein